MIPIDATMIPFTLTDHIRNLISNSVPNEEEVPILLTPSPVEAPDKHVAESLCTKSVAAMTPSDREAVYDDIHAIPVEQEENPELIQESQELLEFELDMREDNQAYLLAKQMNPDYVYNPDFRLSFLRADRFDAKKAASRMVRHFQIKLELFGKEMIGRDIVQDDLDGDDMKVLHGNVMLLPTKDRAGRAIMLFGHHSGMPEAFDAKRRGRRLFYLFMLAARDATSVVALAFFAQIASSEDRRKQSAAGGWKTPQIAIGMPIHLSAFHLGYDTELWAPMESILKVASVDDFRVRFRTFQGSVEEWLASLKGYGIQPDQVPIRSDGTFERSENKKLLRTVRMKERQANSNAIRHVKSPGPFDVLFGKGSRYQHHEGNVKFRSLIGDCRKIYDKTKRGEKFILIQEIVNTVKLSTGLFLKEDGDEGWIVVDDEAAAKKVGAVFRTMRATDE